MNVRYRITSTSEEREELRRLVQAGKGRFRRLKRAQILLAASSGSSDVAIAKHLSVGASTVYRTKRRFARAAGWRDGTAHETQLAVLRDGPSPAR